MKDPGELAYDAYRAAVKGKNYYGLDLPSWLELGPELQRAWETVATAFAPPPLVTTPAREAEVPTNPESHAPPAKDSDG